MSRVYSSIRCVYLIAFIFPSFILPVSCLNPVWDEYDSKGLKLFNANYSQVINSTIMVNSSHVANTSSAASWDEYDGRTGTRLASSMGINNYSAGFIFISGLPFF
jgi:hypothetical protein